MATVKHLVEAKKNETNYYVAATDTVLQALKVMAEAHIGSVMVKEKDKIIGIFTERDYARKGELAGRSAKETQVKELMTGEMYTVTMDTSVEQCMALMKKYRIRHLPVVVKDQLVGLVSLTDVMDTILADRETEIKGLENYILGTGFQS
jgi:CBS domain-containing protein